jgi:hypothetical protein
MLIIHMVQVKIKVAQLHLKMTSCSYSSSSLCIYSTQFIYMNPIYVQDAAVLLGQVVGLVLVRVTVVT